MRVTIQTAMAVLLSAVGFLMMPIFFPFTLLGVFALIYTPVAIAALRQREESPASARRPTSPAEPLPARATQSPVVAAASVSAVP